MNFETTLACGVQSLRGSRLESIVDRQDACSN
jgi:hypothetical protein